MFACDHYYWEGGQPKEKMINKLYSVQGDSQQNDKIR